MGFKRGERQANRTRSALAEAFIQLIHEKNYHDITVGEISHRAGIGRSTFYCHFQSKADVLVGLHKQIFANLTYTLSSSAAWLAEEPPVQLADFLRRFKRAGGIQISLTYKLGNDIDYVMRHINEELFRQFKTSLHESFSEKESRIPFAILAQSIAGTYSWLIMGWLMQHQSVTVEQMAGYIHRLARAAVKEAMSI